MDSFSGFSSILIKYKFNTPHFLKSSLPNRNIPPKSKIFSRNITYLRLQFWISNSYALNLIEMIFSSTNWESYTRNNKHKLKLQNYFTPQALEFKYSVLTAKWRKTNQELPGHYNNSRLIAQTIGIWKPLSSITLILNQNAAQESNCINHPNFSSLFFLFFVHHISFIILIRAGLRFYVQMGVAFIRVKIILFNEDS